MVIPKEEHGEKVNEVKQNKSTGNGSDYKKCYFYQYWM